MTAPNNIDQTFIKALQSLWSAEKMLTVALPWMIKKATIPGLQKNLATHLSETDQHKVAIEAICKQLGFNHEGEENREMKNLLSEGEELINAASGTAADAVIITSAIKVEHYEIKGYQFAGDLAEMAGYKGIAQRLRLTMEEERQADAKLNFLEKSFIKQSSELGAPSLYLE